jgi:FKBP-type peptidyl-prolyl cis-trans isomerase
VALLLVLVLMPGVARAQGGAPPAAKAAITGIQLSFKRDPRAVDPTRAIGPWVSGPNYGGATAQDTVEVRAEGVDAAGKSAKISPEWVPSDPEMVTVSPDQGDDVKITVHRAGESKLKIAYKGVSKELVVRAKYQGKFMVFEIGETTAANVPAAREAPPARRSKSDVSYAVGMNLAKALQEQSEEVDVDSLMQGVKDKLSGGKTRMTEEQALAALEGLQTDQRIVEAGLNRKAVAEKNKREGEAFLAENKKKEGVVSLPSGLQYKIIKTGEGKRPTANDVVIVRYRGSFIDGREFDNSYKRSGSVTFPVKSVFKGWAEALQLMPVGSKWQLFVPSDLAYGERGAGGGGGKRAGGPRPQTVGPNATLVFELELLSVQEPGAQPPVSNSRARKKELTPEMIEELKKVTQGQLKSAKNK